MIYAKLPRYLRVGMAIVVIDPENSEIAKRILPFREVMH